MLGVVIVYEDFSLGRRAMEAYNFMVAELGRVFEFSNSMWKFDLLQNEKLSEIAAGDAAQAGLIIVAARGGQSIPPELENWCESWIPHRRELTGAVAALIDQRGGKSGPGSPVFDYLKNVADRAGMDFLSGVSGPRLAKGDLTARQGAGLHNPDPDDSRVRHWGLNE